VNARAILLLTVCAWGVACAGPNHDGKTVRVTVPQGASLSAVADTLHARGIVRTPRLFKLYATLSGKQGQIQAGTFEFPQNASMRRALELLVSGNEALERLVLPEGLMLHEVTDEVQRQLGVEADSFAAAVRDPALVDRLRIPGSTVEGYLYPSTYYVRVGATAREVVAQMVGEFESRWDPTWNQRLSELGMTRHELVILASIIEGEVRYGPDRKYVSSVYHNRLNRGMRLQADPTVIYALGRRRRLFQRDYQYRSPYNTYLIDGLPPGPIGQTSAASLVAALYPIRTDYLFFVARPDGKHVFSRTHREHLAAIREVRR
jgi:UPF0755 protein